MHQEIKDKINVKIIKLINGEDIVCHLPENKKQLPDDSALLRLQRPYRLSTYLKLRLLVSKII